MAVGRSSGRSQDIAFGQIAADLQKAAFSFGAMVAGAQQLYATLNVFRELNKQLTLTNAIAQGTVENFKQMDSAVRSFALGTTFTASQSANALLVLAQSGMTVQQSMNAMVGVLTLAQATLEDVNASADLIASTLTSFSLQAMDSSRVANLFAASMNQSLASLPKLAFALRQVGPVAGAMGISIETTTAALSELFNVGLRGEQAGTALRNVMVNLINPTGEAAKIINTLGINVRRADGSMRDLKDIMKDLARFNLSDTDLAGLFGKEALAGGTALLQSAASGSLQRMEKSLREDTQAAVRVALEQMNSLDSQIRQAQNAVDEFRISIGEQFAGAVGNLMGYITDLAIAYRNLDGPTKAWATSLLTSTAAMSVAIPVGLKVVGMLGSMGSAMLKAGKTFVDSAGGVGNMAQAIRDYLNPELKSVQSLARADLGAGFMRALPAIGMMTAAIAGVGGLVYAFYQAKKAADAAALVEMMGDLQTYASNFTRQMSNLRQMQASSSDPNDVNALLEQQRTLDGTIELRQKELESARKDVIKLNTAQEAVNEAWKDFSKTSGSMYSSAGMGTSIWDVSPLLKELGVSGASPKDQTDAVKDHFESMILPVADALGVYNEKAKDKFLEVYQKQIADNKALSDITKATGNEVVTGFRDAAANAMRAVTQRDNGDLGGLADALEDRIGEIEKDLAKLDTLSGSSLYIDAFRDAGKKIREATVDGLVETLKSANMSEADARKIVDDAAASGAPLTDLITNAINTARSDGSKSVDLIAITKQFTDMLVNSGVITRDQLAAAADEQAAARLSIVSAEAKKAIEKQLNKSRDDLRKAELELAKSKGDKGAEKALAEIRSYEQMANDILSASQTVSDSLRNRLADMGMRDSSFADVISGKFLSDMLASGETDQIQQAISLLNDKQAMMQEFSTRLAQVFGQEALDALFTENFGTLPPDLAEKLYAPMLAIQDAIMSGTDIQSTTDEAIALMAEALATNIAAVDQILAAAGIMIEGLNNTEKAQLAAETIAYLNGEPFTALVDTDIRTSVMQALSGTGSWLDKVQGVVSALYAQAANLIAGVKAGIGAQAKEAAGAALNDPEIASSLQNVIDMGKNFESKRSAALAALQNNIGNRKSGGGKGRKGGKGGGGKSKEQQMAELQSFLADRNKAIIESALELAAFGENYDIDEIIDLRIKEIDADYTAQIEKANKEYEKMFSRVKAGTEDHRRLTEMRDRELAQLEQLKQKNLEYANSAEFAARVQRESAQAVLDKYIEMNTYTGTFFQGLQAGMQQQILGMTTAFQQGMDTMKTLVDGFVGFGNDMFSGFFEQVATGQKSMGDLLRESLSKMLMQWAKYFADLAMKYIADWVLKQALGMLGGGMGAGTGTGLNFFPAAPVMGGVGLYAKGGAFDVSSFAKGGVVSRRQYFGFQKEHKVGERGEAGQEGVLPLARNNRGQLGVIALGDKKSTSNSGGSLHMQTSTTINLPAGQRSEESDAEMMNRIAVRQKEVAQEVITEEMRPGGALYEMSRR